MSNTWGDGINPFTFRMSKAELDEVEAAMTGRPMTSEAQPGQEQRMDEPYCGQCGGPCLRKPSHLEPITCPQLLTRPTAAGKVAEQVGAVNSAWLRWKAGECSAEEALTALFDQIVCPALTHPTAAADRIGQLREALVALADGAEKCAEAPYFIVQPFFDIYKKYGELIANARGAVAKPDQSA